MPFEYLEIETLDWKQMNCERSVYYRNSAEETLRKGSGRPVQMCPSIQLAASFQDAAVRPYCTCSLKMFPANAERRG